MFFNVKMRKTEKFCSVVLCDVPKVQTLYCSVTQAKYLQSCRGCALLPRRRSLPTGGPSHTRTRSNIRACIVFDIGTVHIRNLTSGGA